MTLELAIYIASPLVVLVLYVGRHYGLVPPGAVLPPKAA